MAVVVDLPLVAVMPTIFAGQRLDEKLNLQRDRHAGFSCGQEIFVSRGNRRRNHQQIGAGEILRAMFAKAIFDRQAFELRDRVSGSFFRGFAVDPAAERAAACSSHLLTLIPPPKWPRPQTVTRLP